MTDEINKPHDNVVKNILGRKSIAKDFVRYYLPQEITKNLDLETLEVSSQSYVSDNLKESLSDLVIRLQMYSGDPADILLKSTYRSLSIFYMKSLRSISKNSNPRSHSKCST